MKILQVTPILDPNTLWAGSHRVVYDISRILSIMGHDVTVCTSDMVNVKTRIKVNSEGYSGGFKLVRVKNISTFLSSTTDLLITPELNKFLYKQIKNYDIIHIHEYTTYQNIVVHKLAEKYNVPYVLQTHGSLPRISKRFKKWLYDVAFGYKILKNASRVIALNRFEAEQYRLMGVPLEKIAIIPNGIDLSEYADLPTKGCFKRKFGIPEEKKVILYLGRIHRIKGLDILLRAYAYLVKEMDFRGAVLVVAGPDDGYLNGARALACRLGVSGSVLFTGPLYGRDKREAYVDSEVYILPSRYETFPMSLLEAYACGKPVITSNVGGLKDLVIDGETGLIFEAGNFKQLSENISQILNNEWKSEEMGCAGRSFIEENFKMEKVVSKLEKVYEEIIYSS